MSRAGQPIGKLLVHGVLRVVLGVDAPASLLGPSHGRLVSQTEVEALTAAVRERASELEACLRLFEQVQDARLRLRLGPRGDAAANSMLVKRLWEKSVTDQAKVDEVVRSHYGADAGGDPFAPDAPPEELADIGRRLRAAWPRQVPERNEDALKKPKALVFFHKKIEEDQWLRVVDWVRDHELRGWEQELGLSNAPVVGCPQVTGPSEGLQPLDRPLKAWMSGRTKEVRRKGEAPQYQALVDEEIRCASSSLGLPTDEARAVILLGYWLVSFRSFDASAIGARLPSKERADLVLDDPSRTDEVELESVQYTLMMRAVWGNIRGLSKGAIWRPGLYRVMRDDKHKGEVAVPERHDDDEGPGEQVEVHDSVVSRGDQLMVDPLPSFMKRLWPTVHTYAHRGPITVTEAVHLLQYGWERWAKTVKQSMSKPAAIAHTQTLDPVAAEELFLAKLSEVIARQPKLVTEILQADDPAALQGMWKDTLRRAGVTQADEISTGLRDIRFVQEYLRKHLPDEQLHERFET